RSTTPPPRANTAVPSGEATRASALPATGLADPPPSGTRKAAPSSPTTSTSSPSPASGAKTPLAGERRSIIVPATGSIDEITLVAEPGRQRDTTKRCAPKPTRGPQLPRRDTAPTITGGEPSGAPTTRFVVVPSLLDPCVARMRAPSGLTASTRVAAVANGTAPKAGVQTVRSPKPLTSSR